MLFIAFITSVTDQKLLKAEKLKRTYDRRYSTIMTTIVAVIVTAMILVKKLQGFTGLKEEVIFSLTHWPFSHSRKIPLHAVIIMLQWRGNRN